VGWKPDEVHQREDGLEEQIRYRRTPGRQGERSRMRKLVAPDGETVELRHEVIDADGKVIHQDEKPVKRKKP
jgi:hypothetical protein